MAEKRRKKTQVQKRRIFQLISSSQKGKRRKGFSGGERDKRIPDENRSRLGAHSDLGMAGSGVESKKPRGKDILCAHEHTLNKRESDNKRQ